MKFCVDCRNFIPAQDDSKHLMARCGADYTTNPVTGHNTYRIAFESRAFTSGKCGMDAILFISKPVVVDHE
jgi:hypothetical protein